MMSQKYVDCWRQLQLLDEGHNSVNSVIVTKGVRDHMWHSLTTREHTQSHKTHLMQLEADIVLCDQWPQHSEVTERILAVRDRYILLWVKDTAL